MDRHASLIALLAGLAAASACTGSASARLALANQTAAPPSHASALLADGPSLRLKLIAAYLAEDVDPVTQNNIGKSAMIWLNPECGDDISDCNIAGLGPSAHNEGFTHDFDLPNETAYAETCASVALIFWAQRMLHLAGQPVLCEVGDRHAGEIDPAARAFEAIDGAVAVSAQ